MKVCRLFKKQIFKDDQVFGLSSNDNYSVQKSFETVLLKVILLVVLFAAGPWAWADEDDDFLNSNYEDNTSSTKSIKSNPQPLKKVSPEELKKKILEAESLLAKNKSSLRNRKLLAQLYYEATEYKKAIVTLDPYSAEMSSKGLVLLAKSYEQIKDYFNEIRILKIVVAKNPESYSAHLNLGKAYLNDEKEKNDKEAIESLRQAISLKPKAEEPYLILLDVFKRQKNNYESLIIIKDIVKRFGMKASYASELCHVYTASAYLQEAIKHCLEAITADPNNPNNHGYLAKCYMDKGEKDTAERILKTAAKRFVKSDLIQNEAGKFYFEQKNYGVAERYYRQAVAANIDSLPGQIGFARSSFELGRFEQALEGYKNACRLDKDTLRYLREAVTSLRLSKNYLWESRYNSTLFGCRL